MTLPVVVPATLSNLGPGFDVLGLAVALYNQFLFEPSGERGQYVDGSAPATEDNAVFSAIRAAEETFGARVPHGLILHQAEAVPRARGLGSSATARVAGFIAWSHYARMRVRLPEALQFLTQLEGHPDNVVAAMCGGVTFSTGGAPFAWRQIPAHADLRVVLCIPELRVPTAEARAVLPAQYERADVVFNLRRLAFLMHGLETGDVAALRVGMEDRVHHPYRKQLIGPVDEAIEAAVYKGAAAAFISGSGSTLAAFVLDPAVDAAAVGAAMERPLREAKMARRSLVVRPMNVGAWQLYLDSVVSDAG
jgi:homoserine kinase